MQAKAYTAIVIYTDQQGRERDQLSIVVSVSKEDAARTLLETFSRNPDCAAVVAIGMDPEGEPIGDAADVVALLAAIDLHNARADAPTRPAGASLH
jgi:hypothetical protein